LEINELTKKFIKEVKTLIDSGEVKNRQVIIDALKWNKSSMSEVMNENDNVPPYIYKKFVEVYGINKEVQEVQEVQEERINQPLTIETILELARTNSELAKGNNKLASANEEIAIANKTLAVANAGMVKLLERQPVNSVTQASTIDVVLQPYLKALSVGLVGKTLSNADEILQEMGRILVLNAVPSKVLGK
jgi:hypothetical protein